MTLLAIIALAGIALLALRSARQAADRVDRLAMRITELEARIRTIAPAETQPPAPSEAPVEEGQPKGWQHIQEEGQPEGWQHIQKGPPPPAPAVPAPVVAIPETEPDTLEREIGARWLLYIGVGAVVIGAAYFVKLAFDNRWITEPARVLIGAAGGVLLIAVGLRFVRAGYAFYGQVLAGGGLAVLYVSTYAAFNFYGLIGRGAAFGLLALVTALAAAIADLQRSQPLAIAAVSGGFLTPFLIGGGTGAPAPLFTYDALLVAGTMYLARRRDWPVLHIVSFVLTCLSLLAWAARFYQPDRYLEVELFLTLFCAMFLYILQQLRQSQHPQARPAASVLSLAPVGYHFASLSILWPHAPALLVYFIAATVAGVIAGVRARSGRLRLVVWIAIVLPFIGWADDAARRWDVGAIAVLAAIYGSHLLGQREARMRGAADTGAETALVHLNGLGLFAGLYMLLADDHLAWMAPIALLLAVWNGALAAVTRRVESARWLHFLAVGFTFAAVATALHFDGAWLTLAWGVEGIAIVWIGTRERREWLRHGGLALLGVAVLRLIDSLVSPAPAAHTLLLNPRAALAAALIAALYLAARLHRQASHLGWRTALVLVANLVTLIAVTAEIDAYFVTRDAEAFRGGPTVAAARTLSVAREMSRSIAWTAYAVALIAVGIRRRYAPLRYLAIVVVGVTVLKVFAVDLAELDRIYRVLTFMIVGVLLLIASYLYQRQAGDAGLPNV